jgi:hypothetical protein
MSVCIGASGSSEKPFPLLITEEYSLKKVGLFSNEKYTYINFNYSFCDALRTSSDEKY